MKFDGEGSTDAGGPYRECFSNLCQELMGVLPLFVRTPNNTHAVGEGRDQFVPNPR